VRFIQILAVVIENDVIHIYLESEILGKQKITIIEQIVSNLLFHKISIYVNLYVHVHCFPRDSQNVSTNTYIVGTTLQNTRNIKNFFLT